jgi:hypothetical protein
MSSVEYEYDHDWLMAERHALQAELTRIRNLPESTNSKGKDSKDIKALITQWNTSYATPTPTTATKFAASPGPSRDENLTTSTLGTRSTSLIDAEGTLLDHNADTMEVDVDHDILPTPSPQAQHQPMNDLKSAKVFDKDRDRRPRLAATNNSSKTKASKRTPKELGGDHRDIPPLPLPPSQPKPIDDKSTNDIDIDNDKDEDQNQNLPRAPTPNPRQAATSTAADYFSSDLDSETEAMLSLLITLKRVMDRYYPS